MRHMIRVRLALWCAVLLAAVVSALGAFVVLQLRTDLGRAVDDSARQGTDSIVDALSDSDEGEPASLEEPFDPEEEGRTFLNAAAAGLPPGAVAQVLDAAGRVVHTFGTAAQDPVLVDPRPSAILHQRATAVTVDVAGRPHRALVTRVDGQDGAINRLVVAVSLQPVDDAVRRVLLLLLVAGPVAVGATTAAAYLLTRKALRPVEQMTADAQEFGTTRLDERIAVPDDENEVRGLAVTLNSMLDRLERSVREKHRMVADASHELRTPLAVMRVELDVSLRNDGLDPPAREVLHSAREEVDRVGRAVDNMLLLAAIEEGGLELLTVPAQMRDIADEAVRSLSQLAAAKEVSLVVDGDGWVARADPHRLALACTNLIENALKFSPVGGTVRVSVWRTMAEAGVSVCDDGPGVAPHETTQIFDRYYRAGERSASLGGTGLGLAICREVALAHGGRVWVTNRSEGGCEFSLALPIWRVADAAPPPAAERAPTAEPPPAADPPGADPPGAGSPDQHGPGMVSR